MGKKFKKGYLKNTFGDCKISECENYKYPCTYEPCDSFFQQEEFPETDVTPFAQEESPETDVTPFAQEESPETDVTPFAQEDETALDYSFPVSADLSPDKNIDALLARKISSLANTNKNLTDICVLGDTIWAKDVNYQYFRPINNPIELNLYLQALQLKKFPNKEPEVLSPKDVRAIYQNILHSYKYHRCSEDFEGHDYCLPLLDSVLEVRNGKICNIPYSQTSKKFKYCVNACYDPNAKGERTKNFLNTFLSSDQAAHERFWEAMGCMLFPDIEPKKYVWFYGNGDDGKGTLVQFLRKIYISSIQAVCDSSIDTLFSEHGSAYVYEASIVVLTENNKPMTIGQVSKLKAQTGGDFTQINPKGKAMFNKRCAYKIIVASNHIPSFSPEAIDDALIRRTLFIKVYAPQNNADKTSELLSWLYDERDYFVTQAVNGYSLWQVNKKITDCAKDTYLTELVFGGNPIVEFIEENCVIGKDFKESTKALKAAFKRWQNNNGLKVSLNELNNYLISKDFKFTRPQMEDGSRPHCVSGIKLK